jgi:hypothetical protein
MVPLSSVAVSKIALLMSSQYEDNSSQSESFHRIAVGLLIQQHRGEALSAKEANWKAAAALLAESF